MDIIYVVVIVLAALVYGYAAMLNFVGAESVKVVADRVRVSQKWMIPFGVLLASGALGLLIGLAVPVVGIAAATGLVVYFVGALSAHIRVHDRGVGGAIGFLLLALAILALEIAYRKPGS
jgi:DoxX-like family